MVNDPTPAPRGGAATLCTPIEPPSIGEDNCASSRFMCAVIKFSLFFVLTGSLFSAEFPKIYNTEPNTNSVPLQPADSAAGMQLPAGFYATLFAAEPDVQNPIAMTWDGRGRLWIAENYTYAERRQHFDLRLRDRILIFEDTDGDGKFDSRKVFTDEVQMLTSIEMGRGGVWAMCPSQLIFIPDRDGDDNPDGAPVTVLDGFKVPSANYHNFANGLRWGPDGWLYGRCGGSAPGDIGLPGVSDEDRIPLRGGIWRYHPEWKVFESLVTGTTNPWGHDWDKHGELFFINTVNGHLWHVIPGAHFVRMSKLDPNPHTYSRIDMHADHWHFDSLLDWTQSRAGAANAYGGGHSHIGMMIYQADNWPKEYRDHLFTVNMHGLRVNQEILERSGSGYVARHGKDFLISKDTWFRGLDLSAGPDGGVFMIDWSDTGECHESTGVHRTSGRIHKIVYGKTPDHSPVNVGMLSEKELVKLHHKQNQWHVRQARIELGNRAAEGRKLSVAKSELRTMVYTASGVVSQLDALWTLYAIGGVDDEMLRALSRHESEHARTWAIRLLTDRWPIDTLMSTRPRVIGPDPFAEADTANVMPILKRLARTDPSALVRLTIASALQRIPVRERIEVAALLVAHGEDATDHNLPLMIWYGLIPAAESHAMELAELAADCELPVTRKSIARRLGLEIERDPKPINKLISAAIQRSHAFQSDIVEGLSEALVGWRKAEKPESWDRFANRFAASEDSRLGDKVRDLSVLFGDGRALAVIREIALDRDASIPQRQSALRTLIEIRPPDLRTICERLLRTRELNVTAVRGLALFDDAAVGVELAESYQRFHPTARPAVIDTLVSRPQFASALLDEMIEGRIPRADLPAFSARQIRSFNDEDLSRRLTKVWGVLRDSDEEKQGLIARLKERLTSQTLNDANKSQGRVLFNTLCAACHTLYGHGGRSGPDLTGSGRDNLDYLLENLVDPSGVVSADFRMSIVDLTDGRILNGLITAQTDRTISLRTLTEEIAIERAEIEKIQESSLSLMPEGLLEALSELQARDLIAYLMDRSQVPLPDGVAE